MDTVMKMKYKFSEEQYKEIKLARKQNRDKQIDKRLQVLELRCEGKGLEEIAGITEFHRSHVSSLIRKYFEEGLQAVSEKHYLGKETRQRRGQHPQAQRRSLRRTLHRRLQSRDREADHQECPRQNAG